MNTVARVLVASQAQQLDRLFDYLIPDHLVSTIKLGARVIVPFQNRPNIGYVWELDDHSDFANVKTILRLVDDPPLISNVQYQLVNWLAEEYFCSRVEVIRLCLPPGSNLTKESYYQPALEIQEIHGILKAAFSTAETAAAIELIETGADKEWTKVYWEKQFQTLKPVWDLLLAKAVFKSTYGISSAKVKTKVCKLYQWATTATDDETLAGEKVRAVLIEKTDGLSGPDLCKTAGVSSAVISRLVKQGKVNCILTNLDRRPIGFSGDLSSKKIDFNQEQKEVLARLFANTDPSSLYLLHGVTGSGKTELYFEVAASILQQGLQVLYLVPEIALTPQTLERARGRFGDEVALLHSNMSDGERFDQWFKIKNGTARFVLGARSALFAPYERLGLIIVDEEHETTYKQEETPRYHSRQVVEKLAEITGAKVIFGSATPAIESYYFTHTGKYTLLNLEQRFNNKPLPRVELVDMKAELKNGNKNILSGDLREAIKESLSRQEQVILLLNRRGHSTFILCRDCGESLKCPACDVALTYHATETNLRCHYCDYRIPVPNICPKCRSNRIRYFGHGTQKLEAELATEFAEARIIRMDVDSTARKGAHHEIYRKLTQGAVDILLGTQMIANGLDLPNVTLVGVISADSTLNIPDFRSSERTFQLLTQVAGRAGRGSQAGRVIFQSYNSEHYSLRFAKEHDYRGFFEVEIKNRQELNYPPFTELVKIGFLGLDSKQVQEAAETFRQTVTNQTDLVKQVEILGPAPALIPKIQDKYRWHMLFKSKEPRALEELVRRVWAEYPFRKFAQVKVIRDRNPYSVI